MTPEDVERIRELRYGDGLSGPVIARMFGCHPSRVWQLAPGRPGKVPNDKLRKAFLQSGVSASDVAKRLGWRCRVGGGHVGGDSSRVRRTLGLLTDTSGSGRKSVRHWIDAETASLMAEAIGVMPWEVMPEDEEMAA